MKISIIITTSNHCEDHLKPCIESIKKNTDLSDVEIIVVANGCKDNTNDYLMSISNTSFKYSISSSGMSGYPQKPGNTTTVWFDEQIGYTKAVNEGIKVSSGEYILLLNDDTVILNSNWLDILMKPFVDLPNCGITGPVKFDWDCGGAKRTAIGFWCAMIKKELFGELGLLD